ncbi:MAG TPA: PIN domain-containing protein [Verrucomicrobiae bacterium]|nr:PIN domain-containing protein [Verrucomicrobiae bacterium]
MKWLLDADVLSQPIKTHGNRTVIEWLEREQADCYTSTIVIAQIAYWVRTKQGRTRSRLQEWLTRSLEVLEGRVLSFNIATAHVWADQKWLLEQASDPIPIEDSYIAATARRHDFTIVTGNDRDFRRPGLKVFNPFKELSAS